MSYQYPILDNKPIDQWKVTELKEELKRRRLPVKGLKDDLVRRLDESLRIERENELLTERENAPHIEREIAAKEVDIGLNTNPQPPAELQKLEVAPAVNETVAITVDDSIKENEITADAHVHIDINESVAAMGDSKVQEMVSNESVAAMADGEVQEMVSMGNLDSSSRVEELPVTSATLETGFTATVAVISEVTRIGQEVQDPGIQDLNENSNFQLDSKNSKPQLESEDAKPLQENVMLDCLTPINQVPEVSPDLGLQVKSDSISADSVSNNEKIELKDNIIADNVKLEVDVVKPEMIDPKTSPISPTGGESHPMDVEEPHEKKASVNVEDDSNAINADMSKKNEILDMGDSEKLNLDRSSGDDSLEDDVLEGKQIESKFDCDEVGDRSEKSEVAAMKEENIVDIVGNGMSTEQKENCPEDKIHPVVPPEKRKLNDETIGNTESVKRQRRWNSENHKSLEPQSSNFTPSTTSNDVFQLPPAKRNFSRSDSTISDDAPKERVVPPSQKPPTNSLRIDRFLRPFTLKAVQELLGKTGTVISFWMDQIKTHCYVTYSSVEEAIETRNAVYNLQWPPNGGRLLVAEFVDSQEVKMRVEAPTQTVATPVTPNAVAPAPPTQPSPRQQISRQHLLPPPTLPQPPPLSNPPLTREQLGYQPAPPVPEKLDAPILTLDDLFRKTKATPRVYYLPLSEEQVAAKRAESGRITKQ